MPAMLKHCLRFGIQVVVLPEGAILRHVHEQNGLPHLWFEATPAEPGGKMKSRTLGVFATGKQLPDEFVHSHYIGTVHLTAIREVWHVYEVHNHEPV